MSLASMRAGHFLFAPLDSLSILPHPALCSVRLACKGCISELSCPLDSTWLASEAHQWETGWGRVNLLQVSSCIVLSGWLPPLQRPLLLSGGLLHPLLSLGSRNSMDRCGFLWVLETPWMDVVFSGFQKLHGWMWFSLVTTGPEVVLHYSLWLPYILPTPL